ncbi:MAG: DUF3298 domain-containing protein [Bacteroidaceae bacterium]|nr:DUF3298 domain-containing protein [Bacteroidaceae bacterium]
MKKYLSILSLAVLFCACEDWKVTDEKQDEPAWGKASLCIENPIHEGDSLCYHIEFNLDTLAGDGQLACSLADVLRDSVFYKQGLATVQETMTAYADSMEAEWKAEMAEMYDPESEWRETLQYSYTIEGSPVENDCDSILTYQTTIDCYLGGAHGSYVIFYYNFDRNSGKLLGIRDFVPADKEKEVLKAMETQLCKDWEAKDVNELREKTGILMLGDLYLSNNFMPKGDSLSFLFNQYDIAPYAAGLIGITIKKP